MFSPTDVHRRRFPQKADKGKVDGSDATTRFPRASCFWETHAFCSRHLGVHVRCTRAKKLVSSDFTKILKVATKIRETFKKTLFTPSSPIKATKLYRFCLSNKRSLKIANQCLAIGNHKTARKHLAVVHCQVASIYWAIKHTQIAFAFFSNRWSPRGIACLAIRYRQISIAYLAIKERKIAESI
jgi:hypothetical protein